MVLDESGFKKTLQQLITDFPNSTKAELQKMLVNQIRHSDKLYKNIIKKKGVSKEVYFRELYNVNERIKNVYPLLSQEIDNQYKRKLKRYISDVGRSFAMSTEWIRKANEKMEELSKKREKEENDVIDEYLKKSGCTITPPWKKENI